MHNMVRKINLILARNTVILSNKRPNNHDYNAWHYENGYLVNKATGKVLTRTTSTGTGLKIADQIGATSNQHTTNPTLLTSQPNQITTIPKVTTQPNQVTNVNLDQSIINNHQMIEHIDNPDPTQQWILDYNGKYKLSKINNLV